MAPSWCLATLTIVVTAVSVSLLTPVVNGQNRERDDVVQLSVYEEVPVRTVVGNLSDALRRQLATIWGSAAAVNRDFQFRLSFPDAHFNVTSTGEVVVHSRIDREDEATCPQQSAIDCQIELTVIVSQRSDSSSVPHRFKVRVVVRDINDNSPQIAGTIHVQVPESDANQPFSSAVIPLEKAVDADASYNGQVTYRLESPSDKFEIITRRQNTRCDIDAVCLLVKDRLDRELASSHALRVVAEDGGAPPRSTTFTLNVSVIDLNDHTPQFVGTPYQVTVSETIEEDAILLRVNATDRDATSTIAYRLQPTASKEVRETFSLDELTGDLRLLKRLDFERVREYVVPILAVDCITACKVALTASSIVTVHVTNVNDHAPEITAFDYVDVPENSKPPTSVADVRVTDRDATTNASHPIRCSLEPPADDLFALELRSVSPGAPSGSEIRYELTSKVTFDREHQSEYSLMIRCVDDVDSARQLGSTKEILVSIKDRNDHAPRIEPAAIMIELPEHNNPSSPIWTFDVRDADDGGNANVTFTLVGDASRYFSVNSVTKQLFARHSFDRENSACAPFYNFTVVARDHGVPPLDSNATVSVRVIDLNDNVPRFSKTIEHFEIEEHRPNRTLLGKLVATDGDVTPENRRIRYTIVPDAYSEYFEVAADGEFSVVKPFDRESLVTDMVQVAVLATDIDSGNSSSIAVIVRVLDTNDYEPHFVFPNASNHRVNVTISELSHSVAIVTLLAIDRDSPSRVQYGISGCLQGPKCLSLFQISSDSGEIFLTTKASTEVLIGQRFDLRVEATDADANKQMKTEQDLVLFFYDDPSRYKLGGNDASRQFMLIVVLAAISFVLMLFLVVTVVLIRFNLLPTRRSKNTSGATTTNRRRGNDNMFPYSLNSSIIAPSEKLTFCTSSSPCPDHVTLDGIVRYDERHLGVGIGVSEDDDNRMSTGDSGKDSVIASYSCNCATMETEFGHNHGHGHGHGHTMCNIHGMSPRLVSTLQCSPKGTNTKLQYKLAPRLGPLVQGNDSLALPWGNLKDPQKTLLRFTTTPPSYVDDYAQHVEVFNKTDVDKQHWSATGSGSGNGSACGSASGAGCGNHGNHTQPASVREADECRSTDENGDVLPCRCQACCNDDSVDVPLMYASDDYVTSPLVALNAASIANFKASASGHRNNSIHEVDSRSVTGLPGRRSQTPQSHLQSANDYRADCVTMLKPSSNGINETRTFRPAGTSNKMALASLGGTQSTSGSESTVFSSGSNVTAIHLLSGNTWRPKPVIDGGNPSMLHTQPAATPQTPVDAENDRDRTRDRDRDRNRVKESNSTSSFRPAPNLPIVPNTFV